MFQRRFIRLAACGLLALQGACTSAVRGATATSSTCFDLSGLSAADQVRAREVLLELADGEALYTLVGRVKPVSADVTVNVRVAPTVDTTGLHELDRLRRVTSALQCGSISAFVQVYAQPFPTRGDTIVRGATVVVVDRERLRETINANQTYFATLGVTPSTAAPDVVFAVETAARAARWRGYGYLFGYPSDAVDFFVRAGIEGDSTGKLVPREFRRIETWRKYPAERGASPTLSSFVYAVPLGAPRSRDDEALAARAQPIYARYAKLRTEVGADSLRRIDAILRQLRGNQ